MSAFRTSRARALVFSNVAIAFLSTACHQDATTTPPIGATNLPSASRSSANARHRTLDDEFADLNSDIPGFGGLYFDSTGTLVVLMKDPRQLEAARPRLEAFLRGNSHRPARIARASKAVAGMRSQQARYEFRLLSAWHRQYVLPVAHRNSAVLLSAVDHRTNRIVVAVTSPSDVEREQRELAILPIPRNSYEVIVAGEGRETSRMMDTTVQETFRPTPGGVQISGFYGGQSNQCSIGFNLVRWLSSSTIDTSRFFVTASHCTPTQGQFDAADYFGQPGDNDAGGTELLDPGSFTHDESSNCPEGHPCYFADAAIFRYATGGTAQDGQIAWPSSNGSLTVSGRRSVDDVAEPITGDGVYMVGRTSGRTFGHVEYPCATLTKTNGHVFVCQGVADYDSDVGDSGGPIVSLDGSTTVAAIGITYYRFVTFSGVTSHVHGVFSLMDGIISNMYFSSSEQYLLDPVASESTAPDTPAAPPYSPTFWATISGTSNAEPGMTCHWYSGSSIDEANVEWIVGGTVVGTSADLYYSSSSSFTLQVHYWNEVSGADAWASQNVNISEGVGQCADQ
jgi:hypothetical protein